MIFFKAQWGSPSTLHPFDPRGMGGRGIKLNVWHKYQLTSFTITNGNSYCCLDWDQVHFLRYQLTSFTITNGNSYCCLDWDQVHFLRLSKTGFRRITRLTPGRKCSFHFVKIPFFKIPQDPKTSETAISKNWKVIKSFRTWYFFFFYKFQNMPATQDLRNEFYHLRNEFYHSRYS